MLNRSMQSKAELRAVADEMIIEGYFIVFDTNTEIYKGHYERIDKHALDNTIGGDIRCLINHDSNYVLGRTISQTLSLRLDDHGLYGKVMINPNDVDAVNAYERVKRGDVSEASFLFEILERTIQDTSDGILETITELKLYEISIVTFPAYETTSVKARCDEIHQVIEDEKARNLNAKKTTLLQKVKGKEKV
jgi:phage prohead protease, HK97 family